jgi:hypothetical protein
MCTFAYVSIRNLPRHRNRFASRFQSQPTAGSVSGQTAPASVSIRQHTSAYVSRLRVVSQVKQHLPQVKQHLHPSAYVSIRQHTSASVSIRQHTPQVTAEKDIADKAAALLYWYKSTSMLYWYKSTFFLYCYKSTNAEHQVTAEKDVADQHTAKPCILSLLRQYVYFCMRQHTSAYVSIRRQTVHALASSFVCVLLY